MTPYELASLAVARLQFYSYLGADVIASLALGAAVLGGIYARRNIQILHLSALLSVEQDLARRRARFQEIALPSPDIPSEVRQAQFDEARESYFNGLDRLAWAVLAGYFPDANMKQDYHEQLTTVIRHFPTEFGPATHYRNVVKLHGRWEDQR